MGSPASMMLLSNGTNSICFTIFFTMINMVYCDLCNIIQDVARSRIWWSKEWNFHRTTCENPKSGFVCSWPLLLKHCGLIQIKPRPIVCWTRPLCATIFNLLTHPALLSILKPLSSLFLKRLLSLSLFQSVPWKQLSRNFQAFPHHRCCWFLTEGSDRVLRTPALVLHSHGRKSLNLCFCLDLGLSLGLCAKRHRNETHDLCNVKGGVWIWSSVNLWVFFWFGFCLKIGLI